MPATGPPEIYSNYQSMQGSSAQEGLDKLRPCTVCSCQNTLQGIKRVSLREIIKPVLQVTLV